MGDLSGTAFAILAGVAPIPANSGQVTTRYRLNRYGDRNLNTALHTVVQIRIQYQDPPATSRARKRTGRWVIVLSFTVRRRGRPPQQNDFRP
jgi:transposase